MRTIRRQYGNKTQNVRRTPFNADPLTLNLFRQFGQSLLNSVLHLNLRQIGVGSDGKRNRQTVAPRVFGSRTHIQHVFHAVDFFLQRNTDGICQHFCAGTGIVRRNGNFRRRNFRIQRNRQRKYGNRPGQRQYDGNNHRKTRSFNKKLRKHLLRAPLLSHQSTKNGLSGRR